MAGNELEAIAMPRLQWELLRKGLVAIQTDYEGREVDFGSDIAAGLTMIDTMLAATDPSRDALARMAEQAEGLGLYED